MLKETDEFYVNNKDFQLSLIEYFDSKNEERRKQLKETIGKIFLIISERILNKPCFINYTKDRKDDMVSDATFFMVKYVDRYDPTRGNPFAFFSQIAFNAFRQNINKVKKRTNLFVPLNYIDNVGNE